MLTAMNIAAGFYALALGGFIVKGGNFSTISHAVGSGGAVIALGYLAMLALKPVVLP